MQSDWGPIACVLESARHYNRCLRFAIFGVLEQELPAIGQLERTFQALALVNRKDSGSVILRTVQLLPGTTR
jgi:hypothetical protein